MFSGFAPETIYYEPIYADFLGKISSFHLLRQLFPLEIGDFCVILQTEIAKSIIFITTNQKIKK